MCLASAPRANEQALYQDDRRVATAATVMVQIDQITRQASPLSPETVTRLEQLQRR